MKLLINRIALVALILLTSSYAFADSLSYDPYAPVFEKPVVAESRANYFFKSVLVAPFYLVKWPVDTTLRFVEENRLSKKAIWIYRQMKNRGVTPHLGFVGISSRTYGGDFDFIAMMRKKQKFPDVNLKSWIRYSQGVYFDVGGIVGKERIAGSGVSFNTTFDYQDRPEEHFYGVGPDSSAGEGAVYAMEMTTIEPAVGIELSPHWKADIKASYRNINISGGKDGGRGQIGEISSFSEERINGFHGDSIISATLQIMHDTRNQNENSTRGGYEKFALGYHEGLNSSEARYFSYIAELARYFKLGSERRVLAVHFYGEHNDEMNNGTIPFHQLAKLGGFGARPRLSHALRGFDYNRFTDESALLFNIEYRYTIWEYRNYKLDTVVFWDEGQVFDEFSNFQLKDFRESYGLGFRLGIANIPLLSIEMAHGDEGTNIYVKTKAPF